MSAVLWLVPDVNLGPYGAVNPHAWWRIATLMLWLMLFGYLAERVVGARWGLATSGFAGGFVSSTATIAAMAARIEGDAEVERHASAGAVASTAATFIMLAVLVGSADLPLLVALAVPMACGSVVILLATAKLAFRAGRHPRVLAAPPSAPVNAKTLLTFIALLVALSFISKLVAAQFGQASVIAVAGLTGFVDGHAITASTASMHQQGQLATSTAGLAVLVALTTNTITKMILVGSARLPKFSRHVLVSLAASLAATWLGWLFTKFAAQLS